MKLYATIENDRGKVKNIGGDKWLEIELKCGNNRVGFVILDHRGGNDWELSYQRGNEESYRIDSCITPGEKQKHFINLNPKTAKKILEIDKKLQGEKQKGESEFMKSRHDMAERANS